MKESIGQSLVYRNAMDHLRKLAKINRPCLIIGERGTGKELAAERLHYHSHRWDQPLIKVNCATLTSELLDSELFGHEQGAFTGATAQKIGRIERADQGTLFLDEIATASLAVQEKLLRVIEYGEFERVGGQKTVKVDIRIVGATNIDLREQVKKGKFREDLLDRLAFDVVTLPPLRMRTDDILLLAEHFAKEMVKELKLEFFPGFAPGVLKAIESYPWPGNIRELKNTIERAIFHNPNPEREIDLIKFDPFASAFTPLQTYTDTTHESHLITQDIEPSHTKEVSDLFDASDFYGSCNHFQKKLLMTGLEAAQFNQKRAADSMNLSYHQLRGLMKKHSISI